MENLTNEQINQQITEKLFQKCYHEAESVTCKKCGEVVSSYRYTDADNFDVPCVFENPDYLESITEAWLVVEEITEPPKTTERARSAWSTRFYYKFRELDLCFMSSEEAARAICLAALAAIKEK